MINNNNSWAMQPIQSDAAQSMKCLCHRGVIGNNHADHYQPDYPRPLLTLSWLLWSFTQNDWYQLPVQLSSKTAGDDEDKAHRNEDVSSGVRVGLQCSLSTERTLFFLATCCTCMGVCRRTHHSPGTHQSSQSLQFSVRTDTGEMA